jgi:hypothetical protein
MLSLLTLFVLSTAAQQGPVISEFMALNAGIFSDEDGDTTDWIEIYNPLLTDTDIGGYYLTDDSADLTKWQFPALTIVNAQSYIIVYASDKDRAVSGQPLHTNFKLTAGGEYLAIVKQDGVTINHDYSPQYPPQYQDISYGLCFDPNLTTRESFFSSPTPLAANGGGSAYVHNVLSTPALPTATDNILVEVTIPSTSTSIVACELICRVMYGTEFALSLHDDGVAPDAIAGDDIFSAQIPSGTAGPSEMLRWRVETTDAFANVSKSPLNLSNESAEYYGTMIADPSITSQLPILNWFVEDPNAANTNNGTRCSIWHNGEFYDNQFCRKRGNSTSNYPKKSYKIDFNPNEKIRMFEGVSKMEEINLQSTWSDKSYLRQKLCWDIYAAAGVAAPMSEMIHVRQNSAFGGLFTFVEQVDDEMLERLDYDPDGALYKMYNPMTSGANSFEKKTREWEDSQDLIDLVAGCQLTGAALEEFLFDNLDIPAVISYLAATCLMNDNDHISKNYYAYRDSDGDQEWMLIPWDKDLTLGRNYTRTGGVLNDQMWANIDPQCHPLFGDINHQKIDLQYNRLIDACYRNLRFREMYVRRLWSLMEEQLQPPNTAAGELKFEYMIDVLQTQVADEVALDVIRWGAPNWGSYKTFQQGIDQMKNGYFTPRRIHLFQTHTQSQELPGPRQLPTQISVSNTEPDPASGDDDEEWIELENITGESTDLSGWTVTGGISFVFAPGTVMAAGDKLYLSPNIAAFRGRIQSPTGGESHFVVGPYAGNYRSTESIFIWDSNGLLVGSNSSSFALFVNDFIAGDTAQFSVAGASPSSTVFIGYSLSGGGPTNSPFGVAALTPPIAPLPSLHASAAGTAYLTLPINSSLSGRQVWLQAVDIISGVLSNGETRIVQ